MKKMRVGVVGCGQISKIYLQNMIHTFENLEVVACCARTMESAQRRAAEFDIRAYTFEEMLADTTIAMVVVLTPAPTHYELIKAALLAGKHVYTEKVMTHDYALAKELVELAAEKGLYLGAAPDTFLGAAWQKARQLVDSGDLGEITSFQINMNSCLDRNLCKYLFLRQAAGGICYDMGVYYLTNLVNLLGPIKEVCAIVENRKPIRIGCVEDGANFGEEYAYNNEAQVSAILRTESGITGTFLQNGESIGSNQFLFRLYGTEAIADLGNPNNFGGDITLIYSKDHREIPENSLPYRQNSRGIGPSEMASAIFEGRENRASSQLALHVLDIIECMLESTKTGSFAKLRTTCDRPEML
jgi:predicted dehydrogenase